MKLTKRDKEILARNSRLQESVEHGLDPIVGHPIPRHALRLTKTALGFDKTDDQGVGAIRLQLVRGLNSVGSNYIEGLAKADCQEVLRFLKMSRGSVYECIFHAECLDLTNMVDDLRNLADLIDNYILTCLSDDLLTLSEPA